MHASAACTLGSGSLHRAALLPRLGRFGRAATELLPPRRSLRCPAAAMQCLGTLGNLLAVKPLAACWRCSLSRHEPLPHHFTSAPKSQVLPTSRGSDSQFLRPFLEWWRELSRVPTVQCASSSVFMHIIYTSLLLHQPSKCLLKTLTAAQTIWLGLVREEVVA